MAFQSSPYRTQEGLGLWESRGKVAAVGVGVSPQDRRWDEKPETSLGAYGILSVQKALDDAGLTVDDIDGVVSDQGGLGGPWAPRPIPPAFAAAYQPTPDDPEDGLSKVTADWLIRNMGMKNTKYVDSHHHALGWTLTMAIEAVAQGKANYCVVVRALNNYEGRYGQGGAAAADMARGNNQWDMPWGWSGPSMESDPFQRYLWKYNQTHDKLGAFAVNNRRNGLMNPISYYYQNRQDTLTMEDYLSGRWVAEPLNLYDCDLPTMVVGAFILTTAERAKDLKQPPAYVLGHMNNDFSERGAIRSNILTLEEEEDMAAHGARKLYEASGLAAKDINAPNLYDGYINFTMFWLEGFGYGGVKKGEALDFIQGGNIAIEGPYPLNPSGGNNGTGRGHGIAHYHDAILQVQGRAGALQVKNANISIGNSTRPPSSGAIMFGRHPD